MAEAVSRWREFEAALEAKGLGWALEYAPADLREARSAHNPYGARLDHLLPADYRAFVKEVGYPVLGFKYYDWHGRSFLPPEPMAVLSPMVYDPDSGGRVQREDEATFGGSQMPVHVERGPVHRRPPLLLRLRRTSQQREHRVRVRADEPARVGQATGHHVGTSRWSFIPQSVRHGRHGNRPH
ncbi:hypothetical protein ACFU9X_47220 [Streptomyces atratus]|uniref:hypothetical protein n=1 Tax=Streptomyces atratus TaxID=1893 RepID=UPI003696B8E2